MRFDYYYGSQADQFSFIRIPRVMIKDPVFAGLSAYTVTQMRAVIEDLLADWKMNQEDKKSDEI